MLIKLNLIQALLGALTLIGAANGATVPKEKVSLGYYPSWFYDKFSVTDVAWKAYTHVSWAFAETGPDAKEFRDGDQPWVVNNINGFVAEAHKNNVKALLSVGGWGGSVYFSSHVGNAENRTTLVQTLTDYVTKFNFDGVDLDWLFPRKQAIGCNVVDPEDTNNLLKFLQELRAHPVGSKLHLSIASGVTPFVGPDGTPLQNVTEFAKVLDFITILNYDIYTPSTHAIAGSNAPLFDECAPNRNGSATSAIQSWTGAGIPPDQLVLGAPSFGHSYRVSKADAYVNGTQTLAVFPPHNQTNIPTADPGESGWTDICGTVTLSDAFTFTQLRDSGFIDNRGEPRHSEGISYHLDDCSQTVFAYNPTTEVFVAYDDAKSFHSKGKFVKDNGLRGFAVWEVTGDFDNILLNNIRNGAGYPVAA